MKVAVINLLSFFVAWSGILAKIPLGAEVSLLLMMTICPLLGIYAAVRTIVSASGRGWSLEMALSLVISLTPILLSLLIFAVWNKGLF